MWNCQIIFFPSPSHSTCFHIFVQITAFIVALSKISVVAEEGLLSAESFTLLGVVVLLEPKTWKKKQTQKPQTRKDMKGVGRQNKVHGKD